MAGYTRQSAADIIANAVIKAAPVNAEFNAIRDAFNNSTGHKHDGTSTEGAYVPLIADTDANNKVVVDTANNRISIYTEVSGTATEQLRIQDGAIVPVTDDDIDLGATGAEFKDLYIDGVGYIDSVVITGGNIDGTVIGGTTPAAADFTTMDASGDATVGGTFAVTGTSSFTGAISAGSLTTTGNSTHATVDINGGAIDGTVIGASSASAGSFTTVTTSGQATLTSADINGGTIDGAVIGGASAQAITGTTITANTGFTGELTGNVTGNVTGNLTGDVTGDVTGDLTGNVTSSGTSTFNNVTIDGTLNMNAGTTATITNLTDPTNAQDAATKAYVDSEVSALVDSAPGTLDTLNELAAALGDDADFSTTVTNSIATKLPLAGGTMTGAIAMSTNKITGAGDPTAAQDVATKAYVDQQDGLQVSKSGDSMSGNLAMGSNKVTGLAAPTDANDATSKTYVDGILGSATAASASAAAAATSESNAATSETNASNSAAAAAASYDDFDDRYLGSKATAPTVDNDGDALITGALYFNSTNDSMYVWDGSAWQAVAPDLVGDTTPQLGGDLDVNGNDVLFGDNDKAIFGAGSDLQIYAVGGNSFIQDTGSGSLFVTGASGMYLQNGSNETYLDAFSNGAVRLFHDNNLKLATTSTGIDVTGTVTADGLTSSNVVQIEDTATKYLQLDHGGAYSYLTSRNDLADGGVIIRSYNGTAYTTRLKAETNGDISFYEDTGTTPKFFWDASAESLGIGLSSPSSTYAVDATKPFRISASSPNVNFVETDASSQSWATGSYSGTFAVRDLTGGGFPLQVEAGTPSNTLFLDSSGSVGIGTSSPDALLHVYAANNAILKVAEANGFATLQQSGTNSYLNNVASGGSLIFRNGPSPTERMRIDASGNLLVGKTSTSLSSDGVAAGAGQGLDATVYNNNVARFNRRQSDGSILSFYKDGSTVGNIGTTSGGLYVDFGDWTITESGGSLYFATGGTNKMKLDASGNLQVVGNVESNATIT